MVMTQSLVEGDGFAVFDLRLDGAGRDWSPPERADGYGVVFVRSGCFRRLSEGVESLLDATSLYFAAPGREQRVRHTHEGGARCTSITLAPELAEPLFAERPPATAVFTPPFVDLEHRRLLALAHRSPDEVDASHVLALVATVVPESGAARRRRGSDARRRIVDAVRERLTADPRTGLLTLARHVSVSPYHLSRIFAAETGQTISSYRNCLRARIVLEHVANGDRSLARVAAELGFADHAHLTRVVRREAGAPPSTLRELLRFGA
jgi:AraC-like DNA-binding protein